MNAVLLFAGQGAQKVGMGKDLAESYPTVRALFDQADATLGYSLSNIMFEGPMEELTKTSRCQPALYAHGLAILEVLKSNVPALDFATGLNLVFQRGSFMEEACENTKGAMLALLGGEESAIRELAKECDVDVANLNAPGQIVLSGSAEGIADAAAKSKDKGIKRAIPLPVAGAYHSRLMKSAQDKLAVALAAASIQSPKVPVVCNFEARPVSTPEEIRSTLTSQVTGSVRWVESMQYLIAAGHTTFIELGPDATLAGLMGKIDKSVKVISIKDAASLDAAVSQLQ